VGVQLDVGALDGERIEEGSVEPGDPSAQIETVRRECRAGVSGEEAGDGVLDALADRVGLDQCELADDFAGVCGGRIHGGRHLAAGIVAAGHPWDSVVADGAGAEVVDEGRE
jgi:hypothetical protein